MAEPAQFGRTAALLLVFAAFGSAVAIAPTYVPAIAIAGLGGVGVILRPALGWFALALLAAPVALLSSEVPIAAAGLSATAALTSIASLRRMRPVARRVSRATVLLLGYLVFSVGWGVALWPSSDAARAIALPILVVGGALLTGLETVTEPELARRLGGWFAASVVVTALVSMGLSLAADRAIGSTIMQAETANHNVLGLVYVLGVIAIATSLSRQAGAVTRILAAGGFLILVVAIVDTFSRSSYLALAAVLALLAVNRGRTVFVLVSGVAVLALGLLPEVVLTHLRAGLGFGALGLDLSSSTRLDLWSAALRMTADHPLLGVGYGGFSSALPAYWTGDASGFAAVSSTVGYSHAHNLPLTLLASGGVVGLILAAGFVVALVRRARVHAVLADRANLALVAAGVVSMFGEPLLTSPCLVALLLLVKRPATAGLERSAEPRSG